MKAKPIELTAEEKDFLERMVRSSKAEQRQAYRARLILLSDSGLTGKAIAKRIGCRTSTVSKWRQRFMDQRLDGLNDAPRSGNPGFYTAETERRVLAMLDEPVPEGYARWNGPLLAKALGDVDAQFVWKVMSRHNIMLERRRPWCISTDPEFAAKAADIVGLYLHPPDNAVVLSVDEKPAIQALERAQGWLKLPNGKSITGYAHEYKRHGTSNLFAALNVTTGEVQAQHTQRRRRVEFLAFMNQVIARHGDREIHVILDNLNIHKPKHDRWLQRHKNVYFHYTPTHASWLNQIEVWFSKLSRDALKGASFTSASQLRTAIDHYIKAHNENAKPFRWTKSVVKQSAPKARYADLEF
jgi:transposase